MDNKMEYEEVKTYPGQIKERDERRIRLIVKKGSVKMIDKTFSFKKCGSKEKAWEKAEEYWKSECDRLGLTKIQKVKIISPERMQYFAGAMDGDGCISFEKAGNMDTSIKQSSFDDDVPLLIQEFQNAFSGGCLHGPIFTESKVGVAHRPQYSYTLSGKKGKRLLEIMAKYSIIKAPQAVMALKAIEDCVSHEDNSFLRIPKQNHKMYYDFFINAHLNYQEVPIDSSRITYGWLAGMFDAEGCIIYSEHQPLMTIAQSGCIPVLHAIQKKLGIGYVNIKDFRIAGTRMLDVLSRIYPLLTQKKTQVTLVIETIKQTSKKRKFEKFADDALEIIDATKITLQSMKKYRSSETAADSEEDVEKDSKKDKEDGEKI